MPTDTYGQVVNSPVGRFVARRAGLPRPVELDRQTPGAPVVRGCVLLGAAPGPARPGGAPPAGVGRAARGGPRGRGGAARDEPRRAGALGRRGGAARREGVQRGGP